MFLKKIHFSHRKKNNKTILHFTRFNKKIFDLIHDQNNHVNFVKCYKYVIFLLYQNIVRIIQKIFQTLFSMSDQQNSRTFILRQYAVYFLSFIFFHIITLNFVMILFLTRNKLNCCLSIICKFSKRVKITIGKKIFTVES